MGEANHVSVTYRKTIHLTDWLTDWLIDWLTDQYTARTGRAKRGTFGGGFGKVHPKFLY